MNIKISSITLSSLVISLLVPMALFAQGAAPDLIVCTGENCDFNKIIDLIQAIINFLIYLAIPISAGFFIYAGVLYATAGAKPGNIEKAKSIFKSTGLGFILMLSAWVIVYTLVHGLTGATAGKGFLQFLK